MDMSGMQGGGRRCGLQWASDGPARAMDGGVVSAEVVISRGVKGHVRCTPIFLHQLVQK